MKCKQSNFQTFFYCFSFQFIVTWKMKNGRSRNTFLKNFDDVERILENSKCSFKFLKIQNFVLNS